LLFADVPFAILAGPGIRNPVMLSDVDAAVTSQAGVLEQAGILDLPFVKSGAAGAGWQDSLRHGGSRTTDKISAGQRSRIPPFSGLDAGFAAFALGPSAPTSHLAAGRFHGYSLCRTLPSSSG
jgi:hypothetical protein